MPTINFTLDEITLPSTSSYEPIPEGRYTCAVTSSDLKPTKSGNGHYLQLVFEVLEGQYAGRRIYERLNIDNPNKKAVNIARRAMTELCAVVGIVGELKDTEELHNVPVSVDVTIEEGRNGYGPSNKILGYDTASAATPVTSPQEATPKTKPVHKTSAAEAKTSHNGLPPWVK